MEPLNFIIVNDVLIAYTLQVFENGQWYRVIQWELPVSEVKRHQRLGSTEYSFIDLTYLPRFEEMPEDFEGTKGEPRKVYARFEYTPEACNVIVVESEEVTVPQVVEIAETFSAQRNDTYRVALPGRDAAWMTTDELSAILPVM